MYVLEVQLKCTISTKQWRTWRVYCISSRMKIFCLYFRTPQIWTHTYLLTYLALFGPQVVHRSATRFLHADLSSASAITFSWSRFFSLVSRAIVRLQVSLGLPTLLLPAGVQLMACLGSLQGGMCRACPYHFHRLLFITPITDGWPVLLLRSSSLTWSGQLMLHISFKHPFSNLLILFSTSFRPFQYSHL